MSRLAALKTSGLIWDKYKYDYHLKRDAASYKFTGWVLESSGASGGWASGHDGYSVDVWDDYGMEYYRIVGSGHWEVISSTNPGTVYWMNGTYMRKTTVNSDGSWTQHYCNLEGTYENERWEWTVMGRIGSVRAKDGHLPDAGRGYTYEKTDGQYTIMLKPGAGTGGSTYDRFAYKLRG
jgi:hypothetical protein